jgi:hypothetical protein
MYSLVIWPDRTCNFFRIEEEFLIDTNKSDGGMASPGHIAMTVCIIRSDTHPELCLDIDRSNGDGLGRGCRVIVNNDNGHASQRWNFDPNQHSIISIHSDMSIDIGSRGGPRSGSNVIMWPYRSSSNQRWTYDCESKSIICALYDLVLDIGGARFNAGAKICAWSPNHTAQQRWQIVDIHAQPTSVPVVPSQSAQVPLAQVSASAHLSISPSTSPFPVRLVLEFPGQLRQISATLANPPIPSDRPVEFADYCPVPGDVKQPKRFPD